MAESETLQKGRVSEVLLHLIGYVGAPLIREALLTAKEVFAEMRAER
jgi:4-carboxymuconolactone decarboxylase